MKSKLKNLPDFLVIGAGKSGTTALNKLLTQHPQIKMAYRKEPNFLAYESIDIDSKNPEVDKDYYYKSVYKLEEYLALFDGANPNQIKGEVSNVYLYDKRAIDGIKKYVPNAKMIAIIRQPAERLFSRYQHLLREDCVPESGFDFVFDQTSKWWKSPDLVTEGFYFQHLKRYFDNFPAENIKVFLYEEFRSDPQKVLMDIFKYLDIDPTPKIDTDLQLNVSGKYKQNFSHKLLGRDGLIIKASRQTLPSVHEKIRKNTTVIKYLNKLRNKNMERETFSPLMKKRITEEIYIDDLYELEKLLNIDLSHWIKS